MMKGMIEVDLGGALTTIECEGIYWMRRYADLQAALTHASDMDILEYAQGSVQGMVPIGMSQRVFELNLPDRIHPEDLWSNGFQIMPRKPERADDRRDDRADLSVAS
jgi:hypothetical protein